MRVAILGEEKKDGFRLSVERLEHALKEKGAEVEIDSYKDLSDMMECIVEYDTVMLSQSAVEKLADCLEGKGEKTITLKHGKSVEEIQLEDVLFVEANLKKVRVRMKNREEMYPITISKMEELLSGKSFLKVHRSFLVNLAHIRAIEGYYVVLDNDTKIPVSKYRISDVKRQYLNEIEG